MAKIDSEKVLERLVRIEALDEHKITYKSLWAAVGVVIVSILGGNFLIGNNQISTVKTDFEVSLSTALERSQQSMAAAIEKQFKLERDAILDQISASNDFNQVKPIFDVSVSGWIDSSMAQGQSDAAMIHYVTPGKQDSLKSDIDALVGKWGAMQSTVSRSLDELYMKNDLGEIVPAFPKTKP